MKVLYLDESGDHNLAVVDPLYPLFVLGGVIVDRDYAERMVARELDAFKREYFERTDLVLHTADLTRNRNGFERMKEPGFRSAVVEGLNDLMRRLQYKVVACVIRKDQHLARYGSRALDPYLFSLDCLVERFCMELRRREESGMIVAEKRDAALDRELEAAWAELKAQGTRYLSGEEIAHRVTGLELHAKRDNIGGLQLADLVVTPIGRHVLGKADREDFAIVESKLRRNAKGEYRGYGLVILPKSKRPAPATQSPTHGTT